jgi:hypothetical protein
VAGSALTLDAIHILPLTYLPLLIHEEPHIKNHESFWTNLSAIVIFHCFWVINLVKHLIVRPSRTVCDTKGQGPNVRLSFIIVHSSSSDTKQQTSTIRILTGQVIRTGRFAAFTGAYSDVFGGESSSSKVIFPLCRFLIVQFLIHTPGGDQSVSNGSYASCYQTSEYITYHLFFPY